MITKGAIDELMILDLHRFSHGIDSTIGVLKTGDFTCFTCEDQFQLEKIAKETRIPSGTYTILLRNFGVMNEKYLLRYPFHRGMLHLQDVPGFDWIYIHTGNNDKHTEGCILTGYNPELDEENGGGIVKRSRPAYIDLYKRIIKAMDSGEKVCINIHDSLQSWDAA